MLSNSPLTQNMMRELGKLDKEKCKSMSGQEKKTFREKWALQVLDTYIEKQIYEESWRRVDATKGSYMSATRVFSMEGGTASDIDATKKHLSKCISMGAPFILYNPLTERFDFLWFERGFTEEMTKCWSLFQEHHQRPKDIVATDEQKKEAPPTPNATKRGQKRGRAEQSGDVKDKGPVTEKEDTSNNSDVSKHVAQATRDRHRDRKTIA